MKAATRRGKREREEARSSPAELMCALEKKKDERNPGKRKYRKPHTIRKHSSQHCLFCLLLAHHFEERPRQLRFLGLVFRNSLILSYFLFLVVWQVRERGRNLERKELVVGHFLITNTFVRREKDGEGCRKRELQTDGRGADVMAEESDGSA